VSRVRVPTMGMVVEGETEYYALPLLHRGTNAIPGCPAIRTTNLGGIGSHLTPAGIAKMAAPRIKTHLIAGHKPVILCLDREQRPECAGAFAQAILTALRGQVSREQAADVHVVIADRTFEAWILADAVGLAKRKHFIRAPKFHCFEGSMGERQLKGTVELTRLLGREYRKTGDGPRLFGELDYQVARDWGRGKRGSRSFDKLLRTLGV